MLARTVEQLNLETELRDAAAARGATVTLVDGVGHFQIRGQLLVNYYPWGNKRTAYVAGTTGGVRRVTQAQAVAMAFEAPPLADPKRKDSRHGKPRRQRARLIRMNGAHCHWCKQPVTIDTSTVEHVIPLARGGLDNHNNRVLACAPCNNGRGHDMPELAK
jgi:5-methylcytosine-specific restriction endonuclease McrA